MVRYVQKAKTFRNAPCTRDVLKCSVQNSVEQIFFPFFWLSTLYFEIGIRIKHSRTLSTREIPFLSRYEVNLKGRRAKTPRKMVDKQAYNLTCRL